MNLGAAPELHGPTTTEALVSAFDVLSSFAQEAVTRAVGGKPSTSPPMPDTAASASTVADTLLDNDAEMELRTPGAEAKLNSLDLQLPSACVGLVLVAQCLNALLLAESDAEQPVYTSKNIVLKTPPAVIESLLGEIISGSKKRAGNSIRRAHV